MRIGIPLRHWSLLAAIGAAYLLVHRVLAPAYGGFMRDHAADILAGVALPAIAAILSDPATPAGRIVRRPLVRLAITAMAAFVWEVVAPAVIHGSVGDPADAASYMVGTLAYLAGSAIKHQSTRVASTTETT